MYQMPFELAVAVALSSSSQWPSYMMTLHFGDSGVPWIGALESEKSPW